MGLKVLLHMLNAIMIPTKLSYILSLAFIFFGGRERAKCGDICLVLKYRNLYPHLSIFFL